MNDELRHGDYLMSNNQQWKAVFQVLSSGSMKQKERPTNTSLTLITCCFLQEDGNFVIYGWKTVWASDSSGSGATRLVMQHDCNLVMYDKHQVPKWASQTNLQSNTPCHLTLSDKGVLKLYKENQRIWNSHKPWRKKGLNKMSDGKKMKCFWKVTEIKSQSHEWFLL